MALSDCLSGGARLVFPRLGVSITLTIVRICRMGYTNIESMDDGWKGWLYAGLPAAKD